MILADKGIVPLEEWEHKPEIKNIILLIHILINNS